MQPVRVYPGLTHRLLVEAARARHRGQDRLDWQELAAATDMNPSRGAVTRALAHLADEGLIEGVSTPAGWLDVRATARGLSRAGNAGRRIERSATSAAAEFQTSVELEQGATADEPVARSASLATRAEEVRDRLNRTLAPRLVAVRSSMAQAWHTFTTLP